MRVAQVFECKTRLYIYTCVMPHMAGSSLVMFTHCISVVRHLIVISALWVHMFHVGVYVIVVVIFQCVYLIILFFMYFIY